ncbi:hypothetical protein HDU67_005803, partial [Dinochytrium kinnereticum]
FCIRTATGQHPYGNWPATGGIPACNHTASNRRATERQPNGNRCRISWLSPLSL